MARRRKKSSWKAWAILLGVGAAGAYWGDEIKEKVNDVVGGLGKK